MEILAYISLGVFLLTALYEIVTDIIYASVILYYEKKNPKKAERIMDFLMKQITG